MVSPEVFIFSASLDLHVYYPAEERNKIALQTSFFRQALGRSDLANNQVEAVQLAIIYFWPNQDYLEQGIIHVPAEVILDTTAPNTPDNVLELLLSYQNLPPPPPQEVKPLEALARNTTPSESSDKTYVKDTSQTSSDIQWEVNSAIKRAKNLINTDQITFNSLMY